MGAHLSGCVTCIERENEEHGVTSVKSSVQRSDDGAFLLPTSLRAVDHQQHGDDPQAQIKAKQTSGTGADIESMALEAQINAIVRSRAESRQQPSPKIHRPDDELQGRINAIVNAHKEHSPVPYSPDCNAENALQDQINAIVGVHASSLKQQRRSDPTEWASPSPAKFLADTDLEYYANVALSRAKDRNTPAKIPAPSSGAHWADYEDDIAPCQLNFADGSNTQGDDTLGTQRKALSTIRVEPELVLKVDVPKAEARPFDVSEIPSPTRNRAKRQQQLLWDTVQKMSPDSGVEEAQAQQKMVETKVDLKKEVEEAAEAKTIEDAKQLREMENKAQMAAMDKICIDTFLESVRKCAWRERVRTPIKGSNLYTKHIRPCRPAGTSVDVKDSSFRYLGDFLKFLEGEGLLRLKPGLSDPVVSEICYDACHKYKRAAPSASKGLSAPAVCMLRPSGAPPSTNFQYQ